MKQNKKFGRKNVKGFTLIELTVAMFVLTVGVLGGMVMILLGMTRDNTNRMDTTATNAAGDIQVGFSFPTGTFRAWSGPGIDPALASGTVASGKFAAGAVTSGTAWTDFGLSTTGAGFLVHATFNATATGTLKFQWSQFASNASATTVKAGSHMLVRQVA